MIKDTLPEEWIVKDSLIEIQRETIELWKQLFHEQTNIAHQYKELFYQTLASPGRRA